MYVCVCVYIYIYMCVCVSLCVLSLLDSKMSHVKEMDSGCSFLGPNQVLGR
jgi:hypothetical protein